MGPLVWEPRRQELCQLPQGHPTSQAPGSPAVPESSTVKVCSKLFLPKGGSLVEVGRTERQEANQQQDPLPQHARRAGGPCDTPWFCCPQRWVPGRIF